MHETENWVNRVQNKAILDVRLRPQYDIDPYRASLSRLHVAVPNPCCLLARHYEYNAFFASRIFSIWPLCAHTKPEVAYITYRNAARVGLIMTI